MLDQHLLPPGENVLDAEKIDLEESAHIHVVQGAELLELNAFSEKAFMTRRDGIIISIIEVEVAEESVSDVDAGDGWEESTDSIILRFKREMLHLLEELRSVSCNVVKTVEAENATSSEVSSGVLLLKSDIRPSLIV